MDVFPFVFAIPIAFFGTVLLIVRWSLEYSKWKKGYREQSMPADNSLGMSELKMIIHEAVEEANEPLLDRIEAIEARLDTLAEPRLTAARHAPLLDEALDAYEVEATTAARPQRVS